MSKRNESTDNTKFSAELQLMPLAYAKIWELVKNCTVEITWEGIVRRSEDAATCFIVEDIVVPPQYIAAASFDTDDEEYAAWLNSLDDETFNNKRLHGHSHAKAPVFWSGIDKRYQESVLSQYREDTFFIFMVCNHAGEVKARIVDKKNSKTYEAPDIAVTVFNLDAFMGDSAEKLKPLSDLKRPPDRKYKAASEDEKRPVVKAKVKKRDKKRGAKGA